MITLCDENLHYDVQKNMKNTKNSLSNMRNKSNIFFEKINYNLLFFLVLLTSRIIRIITTPTLHIKDHDMSDKIMLYIN